MHITSPGNPYENKHALHSESRIIVVPLDASTQSHRQCPLNPDVENPLPDSVESVLIREQT